MRRLFRLWIVLVVVGLNLMCWVPAGVSSAGSSSGADSAETMIDDYWPMELTGSGNLVYATGELWYGTGSLTGALSAVDDTKIGNLSWGNEVDRGWICFWNEGYGVWDLGKALDSVVLFPFIDHPELSHIFSYGVYGSDDFNASNPGAATWVPAHMDKVYVKGWSEAGQDQLGICNDDYVSVWDWPSAAGVGDRELPSGKPALLDPLRTALVRHRTQDEFPCPQRLSGSGRGRGDSRRRALHRVSDMRDRVRPGHVLSRG